jgi:hypothetical protein
MEKASGSMDQSSMDQKGIELTQLKANLETIASITRSVAQQHQGESLELLSILRLLEQLHQEIRDGMFQDSLPSNRQALYALLRDIELSGGWPYIHRLKLRALLVNFYTEASDEATSPE